MSVTQISDKSSLLFRVGVVFLVPEVWWAERDRRVCLEWMESQERTAVEACR